MKKNINNILMGVLLPFLKGLILSVIFAFLLIIALLAGEVFGQGKPLGLKAGDTIPESLMSYKHQSIYLDPASPTEKVNKKVSVKTLALSDFKGKLILLDFWGTWCSSCIAKFPTLKKLQEKYKKDLAIILVNNESIEKTHGFFRSRLKSEGESFYNIVSDTVIGPLFPRRTVPHYAWIGREGVIKSVSGSNDVNEANIITALRDEKLEITQKIDLSSEAPLFSSVYLPKQGLIKYSMFSKGEYSGYPTGGSKRMDNTGKIQVGVAFTNYPMRMMYSSVAGKIMRARRLPFGAYLLIYEGKDPAGFSKDYYNYDFINPLENSGDLYPILLQDLNTYSPYTGNIVPRKIKCLGLYRLENGINTSKKTGLSVQVPAAKAKNTGHALSRMNSMNVLAIKLNYAKQLGKMVTNETGANDKLDISIDIDTSLEDINLELKRHGLVLKPFEREYHALVVRDK